MNTNKVDDEDQWPPTLNLIDANNDVAELLDDNPNDFVSEKLDGSKLSISSNGVITSKHKSDLHHGMKECDIPQSEINGAKLEAFKKLFPDSTLYCEYAQKARRKKIMMLLCVIIGGPLAAYMGLKYLGMV